LSQGFSSGGPEVEGLILAGVVFSLEFPIVPFLPEDFPRKGVVFVVAFGEGPFRETVWVLASAAFVNTIQTGAGL
jgi:hypothetical protein